MIETKAEYKEARKMLNRINKAIDDAPSHAKPVFKGAAELHDMVTAYEREHGVQRR